MSLVVVKLSKSDRIKELKKAVLELLDENEELIANNVRLTKLTPRIIDLSVENSILKFKMLKIKESMKKIHNEIFENHDEVENLDEKVPEMNNKRKKTLTDDLLKNFKKLKLCKPSKIICEDTIDPMPTIIEIDESDDENMNRVPGSSKNLQISNDEIIKNFGCKELSVDVVKLQFIEESTLNDFEAMFGN